MTGAESSHAVTYHDGGTNYGAFRLIFYVQPREVTRFNFEFSYTLICIERWLDAEIGSDHYRKFDLDNGLTVRFADPDLAFAFKMRWG